MRIWAANSRGLFLHGEEPKNSGFASLRVSSLEEFLRALPKVVREFSRLSRFH
jgi:hypothetical protein